MTVESVPLCLRHICYEPAIDTMSCIHVGGLFWLWYNAQHVQTAYVSLHISLACVQARESEIGMIDTGATRLRKCESFPPGIDEYTFGSGAFGKWNQYLQCMHALRQKGSDDRLPIRP